jgi:hypothetical protein
MREFDIRGDTIYYLASHSNLYRQLLRSEKTVLEPNTINRASLSYFHVASTMAVLMQLFGTI